MMLDKVAIITRDANVPPMVTTLDELFAAQPDLPKKAILEAIGQGVSALIGDRIDVDLVVVSLTHRDAPVYIADRALKDQADRAFCHAYGYPHIDAFELLVTLCGTTLTDPAHINWLRSFVDSYEDGEC